MIGSNRQKQKVLNRYLNNQQTDLELANKLGIPEFRKKVDVLASKTGKLGDVYSKPELYREIEKLHQETGEILQELFDRKGAEYIEHFFH